MYVQLDADFYDHPKTLRLVALIGREADTYPPRLWTWATKYAKHGVLKHPGMLEVACRWKGEKGRLHKAMVEAGFIGADGVTLCGWMERTGRDIIRYEEKKGRLRERYRNSSGILPEENRKTSGRFPESSAVSERNGTELNGTERNGDNSPSSPLGMLLAKARKQAIPGKPDTLRSYFEAWIARSDYTKAEQVIMDPWSKGKTVLEIQDHFWPMNGKSDGVSSIEDIIKNVRL